MVRGIGQRLEKANLVDNVGDFCHMTANLAETQPISISTKHAKGTLYSLPVEGRVEA